MVFFFYIFFTSTFGLPVDTVRWDLCNLPIRTSSVDIIITDMPFGKRYSSASYFLSLNVTV